MIKIGICGYGNLGKGVELAVNVAADMELVGIFTRREPSSIVSESKVYKMDEIHSMKNDIDVMVLCGGSATDLGTQSPDLAKDFNIVDSFDNHNLISGHFEKVDKEAKPSNKTAVISSGWDPGLFSIQRVYSEAILPKGNTSTFWGVGVSQGHSDAIRRIEGVVDAVQYTVPIEAAVEKVRNATAGDLTQREKHARLCYVVVNSDDDKERIENEIVTMPNYFEPYDTEVNFISQEELDRNHKAMPHGGFVIRTGKTAKNNHTYEFSLKLESNAEFTASVLVAYARAAFRLNELGVYGAKTVLEIPPYLLSTKTIDELIKEDL